MIGTEQNTTNKDAYSCYQVVSSSTKRRIFADGAIQGDTLAGMRYRVYVLSTSTALPIGELTKQTDSPQESPAKGWQRYGVISSASRWPRLIV